MTGIAFGTADGDQGALFQLFCGVAAAHHGRNAQLTRNDGSVAGATAPVGDDGAGTLHHGFPIRVGHVGHQHVAGLNLVHLADVMHQAHRARADLLANRPALGQDGAFAFELVTQLGRAFGLAFHGFRTCLQDVQKTIRAVFAPLDVHRATVVLLDDHGITGQLLNLVIGQAVAVAQLSGHIGGFDQLARSRFFFWRGKHHLDQFRAQIASDDTSLARSQHGLVHIELIRVHRALHHSLAQTVARGDEHHIFKTRLGVDGEHDPCSAQIGAHHALHACRQGHISVCEPFVHAVADGAVVVQRRKHLFHFVQHIIDADHVQKSLLLTGK